ncbi:MAG: NUDIX hydrolase [Rhodospirillales bacterium]|nr:NUDIX hydrolase [Rhodospirillales bacterium]
MENKALPGPSIRKIPDGDDRERLVCPDCGYIEYQNPKIVVGAIFEWEGKVLLCKRAIEPRIGYWTFPAGFMEMNETVAQGAERESWEEARAKIEAIDLLGTYDIPHIGHIYLVYRAKMLSPEFAPGMESEEVKLFDWAEIPWDHLAFPSVKWALREYDKVRDQKVISVRSKAWTPKHDMPK